MAYYVYFIQEVNRKKKSNMPIKIGSSSNVDKRLKRLQTGNPRELKILFSLHFETLSEAREMEFTMHHLAGKMYKRLVGEWFLFYGSIPDFISKSQKRLDGNQAARSK